MTKTIGYIRVSTKEQKKEGVSLPAQKQAIREYCTFKKLDLGDIIEDGGVSAYKHLSERKGGAALLAKIAAGEVEAVVTLKLDRLFRNAVDCLNVLGDWHPAGVVAHFISMGGATMDTGSAMGKFFLTIMAGVAEMERNLIRERTQEALDYKRGKGERIGTVPYGMRLHLGGKRLEAHPEEAAVVEHIRKLREQGLSYSQITNQLNAEGIPARGSCWYRTSVRRVLARE